MARVVKDDIEAIVRQGPRGDLAGSLERLRKAVLLEGIDADSDGMVGSSINQPDASASLTYG